MRPGRDGHAAPASGWACPPPRLPQAHGPCPPRSVSHANPPQQRRLQPLMPFRARCADGQKLPACQAGVSPARGQRAEGVGSEPVPSRLSPGPAQGAPGSRQPGAEALGARTQRQPPEAMRAGCPPAAEPGRASGATRPAPITLWGRTSGWRGPRGWRGAEPGARGGGRSSMTQQPGRTPSGQREARVGRGLRAMRCGREGSGGWPPPWPLRAEPCWTRSSREWTRGVAGRVRAGGPGPSRLGGRLSVGTFTEWDGYYPGPRPGSASPGAPAPPRHRDCTPSVIFRFS